MTLEKTNREFIAEAKMQYEKAIGEVANAIGAEIEGRFAERIQNCKQADVRLAFMKCLDKSWVLFVEHDFDVWAETNKTYNVDISDCVMGVFISGYVAGFAAQEAEFLKVFSTKEHAQQTPEEHKAKFAEALSKEKEDEEEFYSALDDETRELFFGIFGTAYYSGEVRHKKCVAELIDTQRKYERD